MTIGAVSAALSGCCLIAVDAALLAAFWTGELTWPVALAGHLMLSLVVALAGRPGSARAGQRRDAVLQLAAATALLGPFGILIGITLVLFEVRERSADAEAGLGAPETGAKAAPDAEDDATPGRLEALHNTLLDGRLRFGGGRGVRPLLDVLIEGTGVEKLDALSLIAKRYVPTLAPALRRGIQDADGSVRVLAATVMAQLNNGHTKRIGMLRDAAQSGPTPAAWRALGEARQAYAASGLLEPDRARREAADERVCLKRADELEAALASDEQAEAAAIEETLSCASA